MRLNVKAFALACGLIWGFGLFLLTWWVIAFEGTTHDLMVIGHLYRGYDVSPAGSVIGLVWAFADGLIGGALFAWLYNYLAKGEISASSVRAEVHETAPITRW